MVKFLYLFLLIFPFSPRGINTTGPIDKAAELLKNTHIAELAKMFSTSVDITILGEENIYSNSQAQLVLENFFKNNPVKAVKILHRINSNPNFRYAVFIVTTDGGIYRTSISLKLVNEHFLINELRIENEKQ